ncbi:transcription elongation factor A N-terminal and central domain-containing protein [Myripristis murdjan]|uniref:Transcription elongation factor A N-terminal and central domain containing n=1 Tax=Myripristis murdjan TaxID=586833 RepID=A0A667WB54_9TELE|nr:transcription elongation factor A N-terminal and central domain-containing protein [Myripristis murdjan]
MDAKQIIHCARQIEKSTTDRSYGTIVTLLGDLDKSCIASEQLQTTDIVRVLYRLLKTCPDAGVKKAVKRLLSKWKKQYSRDACGTARTEDSHDQDAALSCRVSLADGSDDAAVSRQGDPQRVKATAEQEPSPLVAEDEVEQEQSSAASTLHALSEEHKPLPSTADAASPSSFSSIRPKCVQLLLRALSSEAADEAQAAELAGVIEQQIHSLHRASEAKYKACVRSKVANLRNPKSGHLRQGLLSGSLSPEAFARMSTEEMAGAELRRLREEYSSQGVSERQLPRGVEGTQTRKIRCKRCEGSDCKVTQVSRGTLFLPAWVRSGGPDEDAMTFVTCNGCGQQWYHSAWVCL